MEDGLGDDSVKFDEEKEEEVLILVLVEDGLGALTRVATNLMHLVLILVLVEDGLGGAISQRGKRGEIVLILVLVEDGLGATPPAPTLFAAGRLNPCFSGGWSRRVRIKDVKTFSLDCLNPCFSGGWSRSGHKHRA